MALPVFPIEYNSHRTALVREIQKITGRVCIVAEPEVQDEVRPPKPYFTMKMISPGIKEGDDSAENIKDNMGASTSRWNRGGQRKMVVDFNCFGNSHEEAYNYMSLVQSSFELETIQAELYASGIAIWLNGSVADLSALLNTGFEGRSQMNVEFGIASNLTEDLGSIDTINITGEVTSDQNVETDLTITIVAPN